MGVVWAEVYWSLWCSRVGPEFPDEPPPVVTEPAYNYSDQEPEVELG